MITKSFFSYLNDPEIRGTEELDQTIHSVPDMSYSVKEILTRFRRGTLNPADLYRESPDLDIDLDDDRFDNIDDLTDISRLKQTHYDNIQHIQESLGKSHRSPSPVDQNTGENDKTE